MVKSIPTLQSSLFSDVVEISRNEAAKQIKKFRKRQKVYVQETPRFNVYRSPVGYGFDFFTIKIPVVRTSI